MLSISFNVFLRSQHQMRCRHVLGATVNWQVNGFSRVPALPEAAATFCTVNRERAHATSFAASTSSSCLFLRGTSSVEVPPPRPLSPLRGIRHRRQLRRLPCFLGISSDTIWAQQRHGILHGLVRFPVQMACCKDVPAQMHVLGASMRSAAHTDSV
jgi:hypothetical protein